MALGDRIPADFIAAQKSRRILKALAELLDEKGYRATKIADIVRRAGVARKTFYDNFGGKDDAVRTLVASALPDLHERVDLVSIERTGLGLLAVELSAVAEVRGGQEAADRAAGACDRLRDLPASIDVAQPAPELLCSLPPGKHGLAREFVHSNQRVRLLHAFSSAVVRRGYQPVRVEDVTKLARLSRRSFYQHFGTKESIALALASTASAAATALLDDADLNSGLGTLVVEVVAAGVSKGTQAAASKVAEVEGALQSITSAGLERAAA